MIRVDTKGVERPRRGSVAVNGNAWRQRAHARRRQRQQKPPDMLPRRTRTPVQATRLHPEQHDLEATRCGQPETTTTAGGHTPRRLNGYLTLRALYATETTRRAPLPTFQSPPSPPCFPQGSGPMKSRTRHPLDIWNQSHRDDNSKTSRRMTQSKPGVTTEATGDDLKASCYTVNPDRETVSGSTAER